MALFWLFFKSSKFVNASCQFSSKTFESLDKCQKENNEQNTQIKLCSEIIDKIEAKNIIITGNNIKQLQDNLKYNNSNYSDLSEGLKKYILSLDDVITDGNKRIIIEFNDNTFATMFMTIWGGIYEK